VGCSQLSVSDGGGFCADSRCGCCLLNVLLLQPPGAVNNWNVCSPSAAGGLQPPDDWEIDISQLHIDSKVRACFLWQLTGRVS
jgi:hypothetical protein